MLDLLSVFASLVSRKNSLAVVFRMVNRSPPKCSPKIFGTVLWAAKKGGGTFDWWFLMKVTYKTRFSNSPNSSRFQLLAALSWPVLTVQYLQLQDGFHASAALPQWWNFRRKLIGAHCCSGGGNWAVSSLRKLCPLWMSWMSMNSIFQFQSTWMVFTVDLNLFFLCSRLTRKKRL